MAIGQSFGIGFGFQPTYQQKKEGNTPKPNMFPGFNEKQVAQLKIDTAHLPIEEQLQAQQEIYREVLPQIQTRQQEEGRITEKNNMFYDITNEKDQDKRKLMEMTLKMGDIADKARKVGGLGMDIKDEQIIDSMVNGIPNGVQLFEDYMNGKSEELLYVSGLKERPMEEVKEKKSIFENVVGAAAESTSGVAEFAGTSLAKGIGRISKKLGADETKVNQLVDSYVKSWDTLGGENIGDEDSLVYQGAKMLFDIAQVATPGGLARGAAKGTQVAGKGAKAVEGLGKISKNWTKIADDIAIGGENILLKAGMKPKAAEKAAQLTSKVLSKAGEGALDMVMFDIIAEGELPNLKEVGLGAVIGGGFPLAGVIAKGLGKAGRLGLEQILGATTGKGRTAISETFSKAGRSKAFSEGLAGNVSIDDVLNNVEQGLNNLKSSNRAIYGEQYQKLLDNTKNIALKEGEESVINSFTKKLQDSRVKFTDEGLDFSQSTIQNSTDQSKIKQVYDLLENWEDTTPAGMDALKQAIRNTYNFKVDSNVVQKIIGETANDVKTKIVNEVPEYADMVKKYENYKNLIDDIQSALSLGTRAKKQTVVTKLQRALKDNQELKKEMLDVINKYSKDDIVGQLAGVQMSEILPGGLMKVFGGAGIGAASIGLLNPKFLAGLITMSPRAIAEIARAVNVSTDILNKAIQNANKIIPAEAKIVGTEVLINKKE